MKWFRVRIGYWGRELITNDRGEAVDAAVYAAHLSGRCVNLTEVNEQNTEALGEPELFEPDPQCVSLVLEFERLPF